MLPCPVCGSKNEINASACARCGEDISSFARLYFLPAFYFNQGLDAYNKGNLDEAVEKLQVSVALDQGNTETLALLAKVSVEKGDYEKAMESWQRVLEISPGNSEAHGGIEEAIKLRDTPTMLREKVRPPEDSEQGIPIYKRMLVFAWIILAFLTGVLVVYLPSNFKSESPIQQIREVLASSSSKSVRGVEVEKKGDKIVLVGKVPSQPDKNWIMAIAKTVAGETEVDDSALSVREISQKSKGRQPPTGTIIGNQVNVRSGAAVDQQALAKLTAGETATILEQKDGWYRVRLKDGIDGFVFGAYLRPNEELQGYYIASVVKEGGAKARSGPGSEYPVVKYQDWNLIPRGEKLLLLKQESNGWWQIQLPIGQTAYVSGDSISQIY